MILRLFNFIIVGAAQLPAQRVEFHRHRQGGVLVPSGDARVPA